MMNAFCSTSFPSSGEITPNLKTEFNFEQTEAISMGIDCKLVTVQNQGNGLWYLSLHVLEN